MKWGGVTVAVGLLALAAHVGMPWGLLALIPLALVFKH